MELEILPRFSSEKHSGYVYRVLRHNIMTLTLEPGTLLNEQELADCLHVSRTPIREAIFKLKEERLMETYPQSGSVVTLIDLDYLDAIAYMRNAVETKVLQQLCKSISGEYMTRLQDNLALQKAICGLENPDIDLFYRQDKTFHELLFEAAGQRTLADIMSSRIGYFDRMSYFLLKLGYHQISASYQMHKAWFDIIAAGAANEAAAAVDRHLFAFLGMSLPPEHLRYFKNVPESQTAGSQKRRPTRRP